MAADLFVFASHAEYSPLVLSEVIAVGTPIIKSNSGNTKEIIQWLGGGFMMSDSANPEGFWIIDPQSLADEIAALMNQKSLLINTRKTIKASWQKDFTWNGISRRYEVVPLEARV
jgi:glycosyltransferase involved in cell wall biosynthesis